MSTKIEVAVFELNDLNKDEFPGYSVPGWYFWSLDYTEVLGPFINQAKGEVVLEEYLKSEVEKIKIITEDY